MTDGRMMTRAEAEAFSTTIRHQSAGFTGSIEHAYRTGMPELLGMTLLEWIDEFVGGGVRIATDERRAIAARLRDDGLLQREIGAILGVDQATVSRDLYANAYGDALPQAQTADDPHANAYDDDDDEEGEGGEPFDHALEVMLMASDVCCYCGERFADDDEVDDEIGNTGSRVFFHPACHPNVAAAVAAVPDPNGTEDLWRLRHMVARGLSQFSGNVLVLDPDAAAAACDEAQARDVLRFRHEADAWLRAFAGARSNGLRAVK